MKILISYFFADTALPLGDSIAQGFKDNHNEVICFHCQQESHWHNYFFKRIDKIAKIFGWRIQLAKQFGLDNFTVRSKRLAETIQREQPDVVLILRGLDYDPQLFIQAKANGWAKHVIGWWIGYPASTEKLTQQMIGFDHYFSIHHDTGLATLKFLDLLAYDQKIYHPLPDVNKTIDLSFVGGANPRRVTAFKSLTDYDLHIYGPGWRKLRYGLAPKLWRQVKGHGIYGSALNQLYNQSKIVLNVTGWQPDKQQGLNLRIFDVPATGAFLLTDYHEGLHDYFKPGQEIETWQNQQELHDKCDYYLKHPQIREKIAKAGYQRVQQLGTYKDKTQRLLAMAGLDKYEVKLAHLRGQLEVGMDQLERGEGIVLESQQT